MDNFEKGDLLTKMECCALFCEKMRCSEWAYYTYYRPYIKFKSYALEKDSQGQIQKKMPRIPFEVAKGLVNYLKETPKPDDPPVERLKKFMKKEPQAS